MATKFQRDKERFWGLPVPPHLKHGGSRAKGVYGCDCKACLPSGRRNKLDGEPLTSTERSRKLRENKKGEPVPPDVKHGIYGYDVYSCRCEVCVEASNSRRRVDWRLRNSYGEWIQREDGVTIVHWPRGVSCPICTAASARVA